MNRYSIFLVCLCSLRPAAAEETVKTDPFKEYVKSRPRFEVSIPPLASPGENTATISVSLEQSNSLPAALHGKEVLVRLDEVRPAEKKVNEIVVRMVPGKQQRIKFQVPVGEGEWEASLVFEGKKVLSQGFRFLNYFEARRGLAVDPLSRWIRDAGNKLVCLYPGPASEPALRQMPRKQPVILNLTSAILWDDYYLPNRRTDHFAEQYARSIRGGAEVVDASFQALPLLLLAELPRIVQSSDPDVILLSIGEHEHYSSPSIADFERGLDAIVRVVQSISKGQLILITPPPSLKDLAISRPYSDAMKRLAGELDLPLVDAGKIFGATNKNLEALYARLCPDEKAHALIAEALEKTFSSRQVRKIAKRKETDQSKLPVPEKSLTLMDGRMPAIKGISPNVRWSEISGRMAHWHEGSKGQTEHHFIGGDPIWIPPGTTLEQEVLLDTDPAPGSIMMGFRSCERNRDAQGIDYFNRHKFAHGIFWGTDIITYAKGQTGKPARINGGPLPESKQWARLSIDASAVGLEGRYLESVRFVNHGGGVRWGKTILRTPQGEQAWIDGQFPFTAGRGRTWQWVPAPGRPGKLAHRTIDISAERIYSFGFIRPVPLSPGARLRQWVYLPKGQEPSRIALVPGGRSKRIYWGRLKAYDQPKSSWAYGGPMPSPGQWTALEIPLGARLDSLGFLTWTGAALWGPTKIIGANPAFKLGEDFHFDYPTSPSPNPATIGTNAMGNQFFLGQTPNWIVSINQPGNTPKKFIGELQLRDASGKLILSREVECEGPASVGWASRLSSYDRKSRPGRPTYSGVSPSIELGIAEVRLKNLDNGFYRVGLLDRAGSELCATTMSILPRRANLLKKEIFVYSNSGYVPEQFRFFHILGGKWCRTMAVEQEMFRMEAFDTAPASGTEPGTEKIVAAYRQARRLAAAKQSRPHHVQYWFNISSNEVNLNWHNLERYSEVIRAVTLGLKQSDPKCVVSTPEINSIAMGFLEKLGENHTFDYLDFYFTYGCSLPVPPECNNKYWSFDIEALADIEERFGRRQTLTGMQYSTGNRGRAWGISEEHQAAYYVRGDVLRRTKDVDYIAYFKFRESPNVNIYEVKDAINHVDLSPKPAYVAMAHHFARMDRSQYRGQLLLGRGNHAYVFDRPAGRVLILWTTEPVPQRVNLNLHAPEVTVADLYGREQRVKSAGGLLPFTISGDVQTIEGVGNEIFKESNFVPAPLLDDRDFAQRELKELFVAIDVNRKDKLNFGGGRRGGRGDLVKTAGETFQIPVNVYNFSSRDSEVKVKLDLPGGLEDKTGQQSCRLKPASAQTLKFTVHVPLNRSPGLGKIRALATADGKQLDPFTTDILVRSPIEILPLESAPKPGAAIRVRFTNAGNAPVDAELRLALPSSWRTKERSRKLSKVPPGQTAEASFTIIEARPQPFHRYKVTAVAMIGEQQAELQTELDFVAVQPTEHPVILDGSMDEWFASGPLDCGQRGNNYIYNQLSQILDPTNFSVRFRTLYDRDHLYLAFDISDDEICEEDTKHDLLWDLDSVQVSFDVDGDGKMDERLNVSPTGRSYMLPDDPRSDREPMITGTKGMARIASRVFFEPTASRPRGSIIELAIPWAWFQKKPFQPKPGAKLGVHVFCVDEDVRAWSARPWKFDECSKHVFVPFVLGEPVDGTKPSDWSPRSGLSRKVFSRAPGDVAAFKVGSQAGLVFGPYVAGKSERFPDTGLDLTNRAKAQRLWFYGPGFIEYEYDFSGWTIPAKVKAIEFAAELSTCYRPGNTHYALPGNPTRLQVKIGKLIIGSIDLLGDPGVDGWLIRLRVTKSGTFHPNKRISQVRLDSLLRVLQGKVRVRLTATGLSGSPGGLNIHGPNGSGVHGIDPSLVIISELKAN